MTPHARLYISTPEVEGVFGGGKWRLLDAVRREGSISAAARSLGRSYRKAWGDIRVAEGGLGRGLLVRTRGGASGGRAELTAFAVELLQAWDAFHGSVMAAVDSAYRTHVAPLMPSGGAPQGRRACRRARKNGA